jgi:hypothetical protein
MEKNMQNDYGVKSEEKPVIQEEDTKKIFDDTYTAVSQKDHRPGSSP